MNLDEATLYEALEYARARGVSMQLITNNRKIAPVAYDRNAQGGVKRIRTHPTKIAATTYVSIDATCPSSCPWKDAGCYVTASRFTAGLERRLTAGARTHGLSGLDVIRVEAALLTRVARSGMSPRPLRLHVGGDVSCEEGALVLAKAVRRWHSHFGGVEAAPVWTYTHRWREIARGAWGTIAVLASVESREDAAEALDLGYAPALVVDQHASPRMHVAEQHGFRVLPCPAESGERTCVECRACFQAFDVVHGGLTKKRIAIAFEAHGTKAGKVRTHLRQLPIVYERASAT